MNYYNEHDPKAAAWLRELIAAGLIPPGDVDTRSIEEVQADELSDYTQCHFFAGIGGWSLALALAGWDAARPVWTGSCPCQPFSTAGKHLGEKDARHLFPTFRRLIARARPPVVFGEQVASKAGRSWLNRVRRDLETLGYALGAADLCAAGAGAPHLRQRLFWVAESAGPRSQGSDGTRQGTHPQLSPAERSGDACSLGDSRSEGRPELRRGRGQPSGSTSPSGACGMGDANSRGCSLVGEPEHGGEQSACGLLTHRPGAWGLRPWEEYDRLECRDGKARRVEPGTFPLAHGLPARVGRLRGYGNAISPQIGAEFILAWLEVNESNDSDQGPPR